MNKGIMMFAYNGQAHDFEKNKMNIDYIQMACANAKNIKKYMKNNNVALVTDQAGKDHLSKLDAETLFTHIILTKQTSKGKGPNTNLNMNIRSMRIGNKTIRLPWKNQTRPDAYSLSPFDQTILIDSDYFVFDNTLDTLFETDKNILCGKHVKEISYQDSLIDYDRLHHQSIKLFWATVLYFTKSNESQLMFEMMKAVKQNWQFYSKMYKFEDSRTYRNDFAISVALHFMQGKKETTYYDLPLTIMCLADKNMMLNKNSFAFRYKDGWAGTGFPKQNIHIMNKESAMYVSGEILYE
tara:strand:+ start:378 stop:1265 length:888 start_codon:yes stop_codon:yes gene_type:complete